MNCYFCKYLLNTTDINLILCNACDSFHVYNENFKLITSNIIYHKYHIVLNFINKTTCIYKPYSTKYLICEISGYPINPTNIKEKLLSYLLISQMIK